MYRVGVRIWVVSMLCDGVSVVSDAVVPSVSCKPDAKIKAHFLTRLVIKTYTRSVVSPSVSYKPLMQESKLISWQDW